MSRSNASFPDPGSWHFFWLNGRCQIKEVSSYLVENLVLDHAKQQFWLGDRVKQYGGIDNG